MEKGKTIEAVGIKIEDGDDDVLIHGIVIMRILNAFAGQGKFVFTPSQLRSIIAQLEDAGRNA